MVFSGRKLLRLRALHSVAKKRKRWRADQAHLDRESLRLSATARSPETTRTTSIPSGSATPLSSPMEPSRRAVCQRRQITTGEVAATAAQATRRDLDEQLPFVAAWPGELQR